MDRSEDQGRLGDRPRVINGATYPPRPVDPPERSAQADEPERAAPVDPLAGLVPPVGPPQPVGRERRRGRAFAVLATVALGIAVLGAPLGWLWALVAPTVPVQMTDDGAILASPQPEQFIAGDGWFTILGFGFGMLAAVAVWVLLKRYRGPAELAAITLGVFGAALLAWWVGRHVGLAEYQRLLHEAPVGARFGKPADLRAAEGGRLLGFIPYVRGDVLVPALGAAVTYTLLAGWSRFPSLRPTEPEPDGRWAWTPVPAPPGEGASVAVPVSWDSSETPAPPAAPAPRAPGEAAPPPD